MERAELNGKSVGELRRMMREHYPQTKGAFAAQANKSECMAVLAGEKTPAEVMDEFFERLGGHSQQTVQTVNLADELAEGAHGDNPPSDASHVASADNAGDALSKGLKVLEAAGMDEAIKAVKGTQRKVSDLEQKLKDAQDQAKAYQRARDSTTELQATGGKIKVAGVECNVVEPDELPDGEAICTHCGARDEHAHGDHCPDKGKSVSVPTTPNPKLNFVPEPDENYRFDIWAAKRKCGALTFQQGADDLIKLLLADYRIMLVGPPATGKTSVVEQYASRVRWPVQRFNGNRDVTVADFVGTYEAANGETQWVDGPLPRAMRDGHILVLDEVDHMPAECSSVLHSVLEPGGKLTITANGGEVVKPHPNFRIVATANTSGFGDEMGVHPNAQVQDAAFLSRFDVVFRVSHLTPASERDLLMRNSGIGKDEAELLVKVAGDTRKAADAQQVLYPITLRQTLKWADLIAQRDLDIGTALALTVLNKVPEQDVGAIAEIAQRHLGDQLGGKLADAD